MAQSVNVFPDRVLYWYGNEIEAWSNPQLKNLDETKMDRVYPSNLSYARSKASNYLYLDGTINTMGAICLSFVTGQISTVGATKLCAECNDPLVSATFGLFATNPEGQDPAYDSTTQAGWVSSGIREIDITNYQGNYYVYVAIRAGSNSGHVRSKVLRLWLD